VIQNRLGFTFAERISNKAEVSGDTSIFGLQYVIIAKDNNKTTRHKYAEKSK